MHSPAAPGDNRVHLKPVTSSRDPGQQVEIGSGLGVEDRVIESPPDGIAAGDLVRIAHSADGTRARKAAAAAEGR